MHVIGNWAHAKDDDDEKPDDVDPATLRNADDFEFWCARQCQAAGWNARTTQSSNDFGADVIATDDEGYTVVIQCKLYTGRVPIGAVQEVVGAKSHYSANDAIVVTTGSFSNAATKLANSNDVTLLDANDLYSHMEDILNS